MYHGFRANSLYDPDFSGAGHQPMYFDEMSAIYNHWTVIGSKITATFVPREQGDGAAHVGIFCDDDLTVPTTVPELLEQLGTRCNTMGFLGVIPKTVTAKYSAKKEYGGSILANNSLQGSIANNPVEDSYFNVFAFSTNSSGGDFRVDVLVKIDYIAVWREQKDGKLS